MAHKDACLTALRWTMKFSTNYLTILKSPPHCYKKPISIFAKEQKKWQKKYQKSKLENTVRLWNGWKIMMKQNRGTATSHICGHFIRLSRLRRITHQIYVMLPKLRCRGVSVKAADTPAGAVRGLWICMPDYGMEKMLINSFYSSFPTQLYKICLIRIHHFKLMVISAQLLPSQKCSCNQEKIRRFFFLHFQVHGRMVL